MHTRRVSRRPNSRQPSAIVKNIIKKPSALMIRTHRRPQSISLLLFTLLNYRLRAILNGRLSESIRMLLDSDVSLRTARFLFASSMTSAFYLNIEYVYYEVLRLSKHGQVEWPVMIRHPDEVSIGHAHL